MQPVSHLAGLRPQPLQQRPQNLSESQSGPEKQWDQRHARTSPTTGGHDKFGHRRSNEHYRGRGRGGRSVYEGPSRKDPVLPRSKSLPVPQVVRRGGQSRDWQQMDEAEAIVLEQQHTDFVNRCAAVLLDLVKDDVLAILADDSVEETVGLAINLVHLATKDELIAAKLHEEPTYTLDALDAAIQTMQRFLIDDEQGRSSDLRLKTRVRARVYMPLGMIAPGDWHIYTIPTSADVGKWRILRGTITKTTTSRALEYAKRYKCPACGFTWEIAGEREQYNAVLRLPSCPNPTPRKACLTAKPEEDSGSAALYQNRNFIRDYQEIRVQEPMEKVGLGRVPRSIVLILEEDLADSMKAGDTILASGTVFRRFQPFKPNERSTIEIVFYANHVISVNEQKAASSAVQQDYKLYFQNYWKYWIGQGKALTGRDLLLKSICPNIFSMSLVKLAVMLCLLGGVESTTSQHRIRGDMHLLLVGDPGTGKSQFLRYASKLSPRTIRATGIGTTNAGLTCAAVRDGGQWQLEAGALVLADRGLCCIDEFGSIRDSDKSAIHEAMEQQTVSVAKAGLVTKLYTRCAVLAATNPKGKYDPSREMEVNIALAAPLLSRFDLVLILLDRDNSEWDDRVSTFILNSEVEASALSENTSVIEEPQSTQPRSVSDAATADNVTDVIHAEEGPATDCPYRKIWDLEALQAYVAHAKSAVVPVLTPDANAILKAYYQAQRRADTRNAARTTVRLLESLIRLSQAHARLLLQDEVGLQDALVAVMLMEASWSTSALGGLQIEADGSIANTIKSALHHDFSDDPEGDFRRQGRFILGQLGLDYLCQSQA